MIINCGLQMYSVSMYFDPCMNPTVQNFVSFHDLCEVGILSRFEYGTYKNKELEYVRSVKLNIPEDLNLDSSIQICRNFEKF